MSDDEEVVLQNSELYKYMQISDIGNVRADITNNEVTPVYSSKVYQLNRLNERNESIGVPSINRKFKLSENAGNIIYTIINTGLLYPDHINDLEDYLEIGNVKEGKPVQAKGVLYLSCFLVSSSMLALNKKLRILHYLGLTAAAYFSYKVCSVVKVCYDLHKVKNFTVAIGSFFSATKKALSFILESEFLLRGKIVKDQPFYVPHSGWVDPNTSDGLKYSGLTVPELRKMLLTVYLDAVLIFNCILQFIRKELPLKSDNVSDAYNLESLDDYYSLQQPSSSIPSSENLKTLNSMYLVIQSECLKRLIFCFVEGLWVNKSSHNSVNNIVREITRNVDRFTIHKNELELLYKKYVNETECNIVRARKNMIVKSRSANDKLNTFINNFLTKADAHMLSLLLDLRMINDWIREFEENNKNSDSDYSINLINTFYDRLQLMNSNIHSFTSLYNDNCNLLKSMVCTTLANTSTDSCDSSDEKLTNCTKLTGIEVGKSDFNCTGIDEVLISLSNADSFNVVNELWDSDSEDLISQKCLPKNVLDELKHALKDKKEEWLEREKKATLNSNITLDNLDFDNLLNSNDSPYKKSKTDTDRSDVCNNELFDSCINNGQCSSDEENIPCVRLQIIRHASHSSDDERRNNTNFQSDNGPNLGNNLENSFLGIDKIGINSHKESLSSNTTLKFNSSNSFADQIKLAQKSFNLLNMTEEFLED